MSKQEGSPSADATSCGTPTAKKSKRDMSEHTRTKVDQTQQNVPVAGPSGITSPGPAVVNPGPSNINPGQSYSPGPSFFCFGPNDWPKQRPANPEFSCMHPSTLRSHLPRTHHSRTESRETTLPRPTVTDASEDLNQDVTPGQSEKPLGATDSTESMDVGENVRKVESSSSVEREEKSNRLDWTGSRI